MTKREGEGFDAGPFSMMAVASIEGHLHTIELGGEKYPAMKYLEKENVTPLLVFSRGMLGFDTAQMLRLWVGHNDYRRVYNGDWIVMLSHTEYAILRMSQSESLFSLMPNVPRSTPEGRLARIAQQHTKETLDNGMTSGMCVECEHAWPCPTYVWASESGSQRDTLMCWDPADDEESE